MARCRITVLKKMINQDLIDEYGEDVTGPCRRLAEGQQFLVEGGNMPQDFCPWAWADVHRDVSVVLYGGGMPWIEQPGTSIACCTDGLMPVVFKIERLD